MQERREKMLALVAHWRESGLSRKQFCAQIGITLSKFNYWVAKERAQTADGFVELGRGQSWGPIDVTYPNGVRLQAPADLSLLSRLIHLY